MTLSEGVLEATDSKDSARSACRSSSKRSGSSCSTKKPSSFARDAAAGFSTVSEKRLQNGAQCAYSTADDLPATVRRRGRERPDDERHRGRRVRTGDLGPIHEQRPLFGRAAGPGALRANRHRRIREADECLAHDARRRVHDAHRGTRVRRRVRHRHDADGAAAVPENGRAIRKLAHSDRAADAAAVAPRTCTPVPAAEVGGASFCLLPPPPPPPLDSTASKVSIAPDMYVPTSSMITITSSPAAAPLSAISSATKGASALTNMGSGALRPSGAGAATKEMGRAPTLSLVDDAPPAAGDRPIAWAAFAVADALWPTET